MLRVEVVTGRSKLMLISVLEKTRIGIWSQK